VFDTCELHGEVRYPTGNECPEIYRALDGVRYIAECTKREEESCKVRKKFLFSVQFAIKTLFLNKLSETREEWGWRYIVMAIVEAMDRA
jgi:hypothetical protein